MGGEVLRTGGLVVLLINIYGAGAVDTGGFLVRRLTWSEWRRRASAQEKSCSRAHCASCSVLRPSGCTRSSSRPRCTRSSSKRAAEAAELDEDGMGEGNDGNSNEGDAVDVGGAGRGSSSGTAAEQAAPGTEAQEQAAGTEALRSRQQRTAAPEAMRAGR